MTLKIAKTKEEALKWIVENQHHNGAAIEKGLQLKGFGSGIIIPRGMLEDLIEPANYERTRRLYKPTRKGRKILKDFEESQKQGA